MPRDDHAGARIAEARKLGGYTQRGFADAIGFSYSLLHQVEGGHKTASPTLSRHAPGHCTSTSQP